MEDGGEGDGDGEGDEEMEDGGVREGRGRIAGADAAAEHEEGNCVKG